MNCYYVFWAIHCFQPYYNFFTSSPDVYSLFFLHFPALTGNGFACRVTLVTGCVMDGILVRALFCLRHATGQRHPATRTYTHTTQPPPLTLYLSHAATCSRHPALKRIFSHSFPVPMAPHRGSFICWYFFLTLAAVCLPAAL